MQSSTSAFARFAEELPAWWLRQMRALVFAIVFGWRRGAAPGPDATLIDIRELGEDALPPTGVILVRRGGQESLAAPLDLAAPRALPKSAAIGLRLPPAMVLHREVVLPLVGARDLQAALRFEMDRLTPFDAAELFWGIADLRREPSRLRLTLLIVMRAPVERLLAALRQADLAPSFIETDRGRIELFAARETANPARTALYALCGLLAALCLIIPVARQQWAIAGVTRQIDALDPASRVAAALHSRLAVAASGENAVAAAERTGDALKILATLTTALPDDTWLSSLTLQSGDLTIDGQSANAARLISILAAAHLTDPTFVAPVTRAIDGKADLFSIHATVAP